MPPKPKSKGDVGRASGAENAQPQKIQSSKLIQPSMPTPEMLASIAGVVSKDFEHNPDSAVNHAFELWKSAETLLKGELEELETMEVYQKVKSDAWDIIVMPKKFPATLNKFLKKIVGCKSEKERTERFRGFINSKSSGGNVDDQMEKIRKAGFHNHTDWFNTAEEYLAWWSENKSILAKKAVAAKKNYKLPPNFPATLNEFFKIVVRGKTPNESLAKFRQFLASTTGNVDKQLDSYEKKGLSEEDWCITAEKYVKWWKQRKAEKNLFRKGSRWNAKTLEQHQS